MDSSHLEFDPGVYDHDGAAAALVEQQRAFHRDAMRKSVAVSVTQIDHDGDTHHWAIYMRDDEDPRLFLLTAAVAAIRDLAGVFDADMDAALALVTCAIEKGA